MKLLCFGEVPTEAWLKAACGQTPVVYKTPALGARERIHLTMPALRLALWCLAFVTCAASFLPSVAAGAPKSSGAVAVLVLICILAKPWTTLFASAWLEAVTVVLGETPRKRSLEASAISSPTLNTSKVASPSVSATVVAETSSTWRARRVFWKPAPI